jgi:hypothetical protein
MLPASRERILASLEEDDLVLDVGGWAKPFSRADWVIDLMPFETRGLYGERDPDPERFTPETWVQRDICDREPFPFEDDQFDFAICSHTLEDIRDPIWVCEELSRVARAGYIEVPSRLQEQTREVNGPWVGWSHHRWLIDVNPPRIDFLAKPGALNGQPELTYPPHFAAELSPEDVVETMFWEGAVEARELLIFDVEELNRYLQEPMRQRPPAPETSLVRKIARRLRP